MPSFSNGTNEDGRLEARYANYFKVGHNAYEFVIDFSQMYEDSGDKESIHSRIVTSPVYAKEFLKMLRDSIDTFETTYGSISDENL